MNPINGVLLFLFILLGVFKTNGQENTRGADTLILMNGKKITVNRFKAEDGLIAYEKISKKGKVKKPAYLGVELVYAIKRVNGLDSVLYQPGSFGYEEYTYTQEEMFYFIRGQQDARNNHKSTLVFAGGLVIGATGGYFLHDQILLAAVPFGYTLLMGVTVPKIQENAVSDNTLRYSEAYNFGYMKAARSKRIFNALVSSLIGTAAGVGAGYAAE